MAAAPRKLLSAACRASAGRGAPNLRTSLAANTRLPTITSSSFHSARRLQAVKPFILADVGEGNSAPIYGSLGLTRPRHEGMPDHPMVRPAWRAGAPVRQDMRSAVGQGRHRGISSVRPGIVLMALADNLAVRRSHKKAPLRSGRHRRSWQGTGLSSGERELTSPATG